MNEEKILQEVENAIIKYIQSGSAFEVPYGKKIDLSTDLNKVYRNLDYDRIEELVKSKLEEQIATKIVNKIITEMGNDIKSLMSNASIRDDFKFFLRTGVEKILESVKGE
jgi:hypothetical protein